jgi:DNA-binding CsgD family transcriptional regulator
MDRWLLVGRVEEQAHITEVIADPEQSGILVAGRPGVGKTRLLREVLEAVPGCHVELVTATDSARPLPFGACAHLLPEDLGSIDRIDLLAVIGRQLVRRARGRPVVLAVDDIHLLDALSAALVHHVATARLATVLLTLRSGEVAPDAVARLHRDGIVSRLELQPISRNEFDELVDGALGGPTEGLTLDRIWAVTEGNVLFARELIGDALSAGTLAPDHGVWRWSGGLGVAPRLRETVATHLGGLGDSERGFLELLSVGEPLSLATVQSLKPGVSVPDLERRGLLAIERSDARTVVRLGHPLFGETLRATMPESLRRQINHDLAEYLASAVDQDAGDPLRLALLREAAGETADPRLLTEAARNANLVSDYRLAERLARASVLGGDGFGAQLELGRALLGQNRHQEAEAVVKPLVGHEPSDTERERLANIYTDAVGFGLGRIDEAVEIFKATEAAVTDPAIRALLQCHRAALLTLATRFAEAAELGMTALASVDDERIRVRSLTSVGLSLVMTGRINDALSLVDDAFEPALRLADQLPQAPVWAISTRCSALFFAGRVAEGLRLLDAALGSVPNIPVELMAQGNAYRGRYLLYQGRVRTAARLLGDAAVILRHNRGLEPSWCLALASEAHALLGHHHEAAAAAAEAVNLDRAEIEGFRPDELRALAWVDAQDDRTSSAIDQLWAAADLAASQGNRGFELLALHDLIRLGEHRAAGRTLELATQVDGDLSLAIASHATAVLSAQAVDLERAAESFVRIGSLLVAAELWATASAARQREGLAARAAEAARHSADLVKQCEGARTPPLGWAVSRVPLTRRERETAKLAASGASNAQIARDLSVSVRTVEGHLYAAFAKLGVTHRNQLLETLEPD